MDQFPKLLIIPAAVALILTLFAWPQAKLEPRGVPIGVVGGEEEATALEDQLAPEGDFDVEPYADEASAREAIEDRDIYGAFVPSAEGATVLTASAGSPLVAQALTGLAEPRLSAPPYGDAASAVDVEDVVPADPDDPRGSAFNALVLPLLIGGIITGVLVAFIITPPGPRQVAALVLASALAGLAAVVIAQAWLGILEGGWLANAAVLSLLVLAIASVVAGLVAVVGPPGIGIAAVLMVLLGNPWSGLGTAPELLPRPIGDIGQLFPPAAGGQALRDTAFFDGATLGGHLAVLSVWIAIGLSLLAIGARRLSRTDDAAAAGGG
jgi:hypothetical protein